MREIELKGEAKTEAVEERYRRMLKEWDESGETAAVVGARHGIAGGTLRWWRSELKRRDRRRASVRPVQATELLPVRLTSPWPARDPSAAFEVALNGGRRVVRIPAGFDPADVRALVEAVEGGPC
jgi:hypothetical protein